MDMTEIKEKLLQTMSKADVLQAIDDAITIADGIDMSAAGCSYGGFSPVTDVLTATTSKPFLCFQSIKFCNSFSIDALSG